MYGNILKDKGMGDIRREQVRKATEASFSQDLQTPILNLRQNRNGKQQGQLKEDITEPNKKASVLVA